MAYPMRSYAPTRHPPSPVRHKVSLTLDEEALRLARACAHNRGISLSAWLALAVEESAACEEDVRFWDQELAGLGATFTEEEDRQIDEELAREGVTKLIPYAPSGARRRVSTTLDDELLGRARENAQQAGLSLSDWLARSAWYRTQIDLELRRRRGGDV